MCVPREAQYYASIGGKLKARAIFAALVGLSVAAGPALAQETAAPPPPAQNTQTEVIGPPQLRDFSLNGTVTRRPTEPAQPAPTAREPAQRPPAADARPSRQQPAPARETATPSEAAPAEPQLPTVAAQEEPAPLLPPTPSAPFQDVAPPAEQSVNPTNSLSPMLPWLVAALALGGAAAWYFLRQRPRRSFAGAARTDQLDIARDRPAPSPAPAPAPKPDPVEATVAPTPAPQAAEPPAKLGPGGTIVSTRLRPWLEIEFVAQRTILEDAAVGVEFEVSVFNSGSVPARDVLVEARLLNAGPEHVEELRRFYTEPVAQGSRVPVIEPLKRVTVTNAVLLPRTQVQPIEIEGRQLLVPVVAFNALYSWGSGKGQTSTSFVVGKQTQGEKLAPFRLDSGARLFRNLAAREHELRVRS